MKYIRILKEILTATCSPKQNRRYFTERTAEVLYKCKLSMS